MARGEHDSGLPTPIARELLSLHELARLTDLHPDLVGRLVALGLVDPAVERPRPLFAVDCVWRLRRVRRLRRDFGGSYASVGLILELLDRIDELERRLARLEPGRRGGPAAPEI
jgi:hypothetical protein